MAKTVAPMPHLQLGSMRYEVWLAYDASEPADDQPEPIIERVARFKYRQQAVKFARSMASAKCQARVVDNPEFPA